MQPTLKLRDFFNISAMAEAKDFKFGAHTFYEDY